LATNIREMKLLTELHEIQMEDDKRKESRVDEIEDIDD